MYTTFQWTSTWQCLVTIPSLSHSQTQSLKKHYKLSHYHSCLYDRIKVTCAAVHDTMCIHLHNGQYLHMVCIAMLYFTGIIRHEMEQANKMIWNRMKQKETQVQEDHLSSVGKLAKICHNEHRVWMFLTTPELECLSCPNSVFTVTDSCQSSYNGEMSLLNLALDLGVFMGHTSWNIWLCFASFSSILGFKTSYVSLIEPVDSIVGMCP